MLSADQEYSVFMLGRAVVLSCRPCVRNLRPAVVVVVVLLAAVLVAGDELSGDKVGGRASVQVSRIIGKSATPLLGSCRREELDRVAGRKLVASYDEDSWGGFWSIVSWFFLCCLYFGHFESL